MAIALFVGVRERPWLSQAEPLAWDLTLIGRDGQQVVLSYRQVLALPSVETYGGFFSSVGTIYGPYKLKGVRIETLFDLIGGITPSDVLLVSAQDGYSSVFDYGQLNGEIDTFQPDTFRLVREAPVEFLLVFEQQGKPLSDSDGKPLRLAIVSRDGLLTEGHWWVKWVNHLEIRTLVPAPSTTR